MRCVLVGAVLLMVSACGGRVDGPGGDNAVGGNSGASGGTGGKNLKGDSEKLPPCAPGFEPGTSSEPCNWMADGLCYVERIDACACVCPTSGSSTCQSGFLDDPPVEVFCY